MNSKLELNYATLITNWPQLEFDNHWPKSPICDDYNCVAWVLGKDDDNWAPYENHTWFSNCKKLPQNYLENDLQYYVEGFKTLGYAECENDQFEEGYEKIAFYFDENQIQHVAKQLNNQLWTSKLGDKQDINHTLDSLEGGKYGRVILFMKRKL